MVEGQQGLEVLIKYKDQKYSQVNSPTLSHSQEIAILKKDLAHLRVHSPAQRNVQRIDGAFVLRWPTAGTSPKVEGKADSLHMRWFKLCSNGPEALKLREFLSIESITLTQDGAFLRSTDSSTPNEGLHSAHGALAARLGDAEQLQQSASAPVPTYTSPAKPQPSRAKAPPTAPRSDRLQATHQLKRKMSNAGGGPPPTRQKLDIHDTRSYQSSSSPSVEHHQEIPTTTSPKVPPHFIEPLLVSLPMGDPAPSPHSPHSHTPIIIQRPPTSVLEAGEIFPLPASSPTSIVPIALSDPLPETIFTTFSAPLDSPATTTTPLSAPVSASSPTTLAVPQPQPHRSPVPSGPRLSPHSAYPPQHTPSSHSHSHSHTRAPSPNDEPSGRRDIQRLTRELWDTRRQLTATQAREQVILDDLERLGVRPEELVSGYGGTSSGGGNGSGSVSRDEFIRIETELRAERMHRIRAERLLHDVENECRAPFVVPALFRTFMEISDLTS